MSEKEKEKEERVKISECLRERESLKVCVWKKKERDNVRECLRERLKSVFERESKWAREEN